MSSEVPGGSRQAFVSNAVESAIRIGALLIIAIWCFDIVRPFVVPVVWGVIIAVASYPMQRALERLTGGRAGLAATVLTLVLLVVLFVPALLLGAVLAENVQVLAEGFEAGTLVIPHPPPRVAEWPLIGEPLSATWSLASTNLTAAAEQLRPQIELLLRWLLGVAAGTGLGLLQMLLAVVISGVLLASAPKGAEFTRRLAQRLAGRRGPEFAELAGATVRGVARGIIGVAFIQATLAGFGMAVAGVPFAGFWALICLLLAVVQVGVAPVMIGAVIYMFSAADALSAALFLIWAVFVSVLDNVLKPLLIGRGLDLPIAIIFVGTIGGMLSSGIVGLFVGPVVLAVAYRLVQAWLAASPEAERPAA